MIWLQASMRIVRSKCTNCTRQQSQATTLLCGGASEATGTTAAPAAVREAYEAEKRALAEELRRERARCEELEDILACLKRYKGFLRERACIAHMLVHGGCMLNALCFPAAGGSGVVQHCLQEG